MILIQSLRVSLSEMGFAVLLRGGGDPRTLPIFIGNLEAQSIAMVLDGVQPPRPMTHDLMVRLMEQAGRRLTRVEICALRENTFFAKLVLESDDGEVEIDARPSDALALALRAKASIYVAPEVMETAGLRLDDAGRPGKPESAQSRVEDLKRKLEKAVEDERYEDAARLRDQIQKLTQTN